MRSLDYISLAVASSNMTTSVQQLLDTFDALSDNEKQQAAVALLHRILRDIPGDFPDEYADYGRRCTFP